MWQYNYQSNSDELYHHGIKGMKWGVRRRARMGARLEKNIDAYSKDRDRLESKRKNNNFKGKSNAKVNAKLSETNKYIKNATSLRNKTVAGLSKKDIERGRKELKALGILSYHGGIIGGAIGETVNQIKVDQYIKKYS